jgi:hypothetical protein
MEPWPFIIAVKGPAPLKVVVIVGAMQLLITPTKLLRKVEPLRL